MNVNIKATKVELTSNIKDYIQEKVNMLEKYLGSITATNCDFEIERAVGNQQNGKIYRAELNLQLPGELLRVEKTEKEILKAIEKVKDHMQRSIKRYKEKRIDRKRKG